MNISLSDVDFSPICYCTIYLEASRGEGAKSEVVGSIPTRGDEIFNVYFPFLRSGFKVKRGVEFRDATRNASRIRQKVENGVF